MHAHVFGNHRCNDASKTNNAASATLDATSLVCVANAHAYTMFPSAETYSAMYARVRFSMATRGVAARGERAAPVP